MKCRRDSHAANEASFHHRARRATEFRVSGARDRLGRQRWWGEASPSRFYGETADTVAAVLPRLAAAIEGIIRGHWKRSSASWI